jgi:excisionase family DNA binding protein
MAVAWRAVSPVTAHADNDSTGGGGAPLAADDEFLTVGDVAQCLKVHPQTVRTGIVRGELRAIRICRTVRIRRADFDAMLKDARLAPPIRARALKPQRHAAERRVASEPRAGD